MKKLLELEAKLKKARAELEKNAMMGYGGNDPQTGMPPGTAGGNMGKQDLENHNYAAKADDDDDAKKDKKMIENKMDEHNEDKHGEPEDEDSAKKKLKKGELVKFYPNGQWSLEKATMDPKPNGKFDVPVKEVYDGDDEYVHVGNRGVDGEDHGKTDKISDKEKQALKED